MQHADMQPATDDARTDTASPKAVSDRKVDVDELKDVTSDEKTSSDKKENDIEQVGGDKDHTERKETQETDAPLESGMFKTPLSIAAPRLIKKKMPKAAEAFTDQTETKKPEESVIQTTFDETEHKPAAPEPKAFKYATPAEQMKTQDIPIPYKEPVWGTLCTDNYSFEIIKNGTVIDTLDLRSKSFYVFGRLPSCDVMLEHPSLSRYHAVVQYCGVQTDNMPTGWYLYDLDSTHGSWVNKVKVKPRVYVRLRVGYVIKFGGSSRLNILQGPSDDQDEESELPAAELKMQRQRLKKEAELLRQAQLLEVEEQKMLEEKAKQDTGCLWGMDDDVEEESTLDLSTSITELQNEDLYIEDPKKALRGYFEREGYDLPEYDIVEEGRGQYKCRVELPIDTPSGEPIIVEVTVSGKKKEAVAACALEACRILDQHGELRKAIHEGRAHKKKNLEENDFYESDEDTFLDRTGDIERKRKLRMKRAGKKNEKAETYESLVEKLSEIEKHITEIEKKLQQAKDQTEAFEAQGLDVFDAYMMSLKAGTLDATSKMKLKRELFDLKQEQKRIEKLANIAKPALANVTKLCPTSKPGVSAMFGKMRGPIKHVPKLPKPQPKIVMPQKDATDEEFMEEEDEEDEDVPVSKTQSKELTPKSTGSEGSKGVKGQPGQANAHSKVQAEAKIIGPTLPSTGDISVDTPVAMDTCDKQSDSKSVHFTHTDNPESSQVKHKIDSVENAGAPSQTLSKKKKVKKSDTPSETSAYSDMSTDPDYAVWVPPTGQTGDGKTYLNEKYGY